jgi:hypothetical protein
MWCIEPRWDSYRDARSVSNDLLPGFPLVGRGFLSCRFASKPAHSSPHYTGRKGAVRGFLGVKKRATFFHRSLLELLIQTNSRSGRRFLSFFGVIL